MRHYTSVGGGTYRHPHLRCRVVKPHTRGCTDLSTHIGYPWYALFAVVRTLRAEGYAVHSVYRLWANNWLVITTEGWESC